jgi:predicted dehydrogenase
MGMKLRWGILGTGNIARQFAAGVIHSTRSQLTAVGSRNRESAEAFARAFQIPQKFSRYDDLLTDDTCDAIYISLPNTMHHEWTIKALRAGKHVLCEKPLSMTVSQAEEMFDVARKHGRILIEAFMYRAHPQTHKALELVRSGRIGRVKLIRTSFCYRVRQTQSNIRFDPSLGGGALMDVGCYCLNFSRLIAGQEPDQLYRVSHTHPSGVDELTSVIGQFPDGTSMEFTVGMMTQADNTAFICGEEGYIRIPVPWKPPPGNGEVILGQSVPPKQDNPSVTPTVPTPTVYRIQDSRPLYGIEADAFADTIFDSAPPFVTPEDTIGNTVCLERLRQQRG